MYKVVYNSCYGGFSLSPKAEKLLWERKTGKEIFAYALDYRNHNYIKVTDFGNCSSLDTFYFVTKDYGDILVDEIPNECMEYDIFKIHRHDKDLVAVVEELGEEANGSCAKLRIEEISTPMYRITDYDGYESVETPDNVGWVVIETNALPEK